jgi:hypothetical protein
MVQVAAGAREEAAFFARLWESEVLVPQEGPGELREQVAGPGAEVAMRVLTVRGVRAVPAYSSEAQLRKVARPEWSGFVRLPVRALQTMLAGTGTHLVINPGGDLSVMLDPAQVAALPEHHPPATNVPADVAVSAASVEEPVLEALREFFASVGAVRAAYAASVDGRTAVGVLLDPGASSAEVLSAATERLGAAGLPPFGMLAIDPENPGPVGGWMLSEGRPFYER